MDLTELEAFIGLTYLRGIYGKNHPVSFLWDKSYGPAIFRDTLARDRYKEILRYLRFDQKDTRCQRQGDKLMHIREIFQIFQHNCCTAYVPEPNLTADEQLLPLKTRCSFITFMPQKPDKYGVKFWLLCEVKTKYVANIEIYLGAQEKESRNGIPLSEDVVLRLVKPFANKGYNVCVDNFFTSLPLAVKLLEKRTTLLGTMRKNRRELNSEMVQTNNSLYDSTFFYDIESKALFVRYQCKKNKCVCLLSTMHSSPRIDETSQKKKPEVIMDYNQNKVGVDCADMMAKHFSTHSACFRWPVALWSNMLDIAGINGSIIFSAARGELPSRRKFLIRLAEQLTSEHKERRRRNQPSGSIFSELDVQNRRRKCQIITGCKNMTITICQRCSRPTCGRCAIDNSRVTVCKCKDC